MRRSLLTCLCTIFSIFICFAETVTLNFASTSDGNNEFGVPLGICSDIEFISKGIKVVPTKGTAKDATLESTRLRVFDKGIFTISTIDGRNINKIDLSSVSGNIGISSGEWTGSSASVSFTCNNSVSVYSLTITIEGENANMNPKISVPGGSFYFEQSVAITTDVADATVYYTTDGATPSSSNGILYESPIIVDRAMILKAIAVKDGKESEIMEETYNFIMSPPSINTKKSNFVEYIDIVLSSTDKKASIMWCDIENEELQNYIEPLRITETKTIKYKAVREGWEDSEFIQKDYIRVPTNIDSETELLVSGTEDRELSIEKDKTEFFTFNFDKGSSDLSPQYKKSTLSYISFYKGNKINIQCPGISIKELTVVFNDNTIGYDILINGEDKLIFLGSDGTWKGDGRETITLGSIDNREIKIKKIRIKYRSIVAEANTNLSKILSMGEHGVKYTVNLELEGVVADGDILYAATNNNICSSPSINPQPGRDYYEDKMVDFAQNDWIALKVENAEQYVGKRIDAGLKGIYDSSFGTPKLDVTDIVRAESHNRDINRYQIRNFLGAVINPSDHKIFFVTPQINEYATVTAKLIQKEGAFYLTSQDGEIAVDNSLGVLNSEQESYHNFNGIILKREISQKTRIKTVNQLPNGYEYIFKIIADKGIATGIDGTIINDKSFSAYGIDGGMIVSAETNCNIEVYNLSGSKIKNINNLLGVNTISINPGIYIIKTNNHAIKVVVK